MASQPTLPENAALLYKGLLSNKDSLSKFSKALLNPYFWGGYVKEGMLTSYNHSTDIVILQDKLPLNPPQRAS